MVKASSCGNSSGHRFGSRFGQKSFFALFSYENEHSALQEEKMSYNFFSGNSDKEVKFSQPIDNRQFLSEIYSTNVCLSIFIISEE